jgi:glycosyltransferase involved in cell wall biosynthesis
MSQNLWFGDEIYKLQAHGGISVIWNNIIPLLKVELEGFTWSKEQPCDIYLPSYYSAKPEGSKSVVLCYDWIANRYPGIPKHTPDIQWKHAAIANADAVIAISQWTADDVKKFTGRDASVAYPATTLERASHEDVQAFKAKYNLPEHYVLIVGRRGLYKNVATYWQALGLLLNNMPFTLMMGGEEARAVNDFARQASVQLNLPASDLAAAYTGALCLVYPSLYEGFGLPVLEAYACGCPVICGNGGALAEINEAALVVDVTKPREIAQALVKMSDPGVRIDHILRGYDVVKRFGWKQMAERVAAVIRTVAEKEPVA